MEACALDEGTAEDHRAWGRGVQSQGRRGGGAEGNKGASLCLSVCLFGCLSGNLSLLHKLFPLCVPYISYL